MSEAPERKELKAQWKTEVEVPSITKADVAKHKSKTDLWMIIHGKGTIVRLILLISFADLQSSVQCHRVSS